MAASSQPPASGETLQLSLREDVIAISCGYCIAGLKADGTVVADRIISNTVSNWRNIISVAVSGYDAVGLKADGTVVSTRNGDDVSSWRNIVAIAAGEYYVLGLMADGSVVVSGDLEGSQPDVSGWNLFS